MPGLKHICFVDKLKISTINGDISVSNFVFQLSRLHGHENESNPSAKFKLYNKARRAAG